MIRRPRRSPLFPYTPLSRSLESYAFSTTFGRYVRIVGHGNSTSNWNSIMEVAILDPTTPAPPLAPVVLVRSEEHTSELQSQSNLVCRLLLEKKKTVATRPTHSPVGQAHRVLRPRCRWPTRRPALAAASTWMLSDDLPFLSSASFL